MFSSTCIYTIVHSDTLKKAAAEGGRLESKENKRWITGGAIFATARQENQKVPVLFADAADCSKLIYWGILEDLLVDDESTRYTVSGLTPLASGYAPQDLILKKSGAHIAPRFIRPYAICNTPDFLS